MSEKILNCSLILSDVIELEGDLTKNIITYNGGQGNFDGSIKFCLLYTSPSPRDMPRSRMPSSA